MQGSMGCLRGFIMSAIGNARHRYYRGSRTRDRYSLHANILWFTLTVVLVLVLYFWLLQYPEVGYIEAGLITGLVAIVTLGIVLYFRKY